MNFKNIIVGLILVIVLGIIASNTFSIYESGFTVTSITTNPNLITPSTDLNSATFIINTNFDSGGQSIVGYLSQDEMKQESGYETQFPLVINAQAVTEVVDYPIINKPNDKLYIYNLVALKTSILNSDPACPDQGNPFYVLRVQPTVLHPGAKYCVYKKDVGVTGVLDTPGKSFFSKISLTARDQTITKEINNFDSTSINFEDNNGNFLAKAQWTGNLVTGNEPPGAHLYATTYRTDLGTTNARWRTVDKSDVESYLRSIENDNVKLFAALGTTQCATRDFVGCQTNIESVVNEMNTKLNIASTGAEVGIGDNPNAYINKNDLEGSSLRVTFDRRFAVPNILFTVNAAWVGVKFGIGQPQIVSANCPPFASGDNIGVCDVVIKNVGTAVGTFRASFIPASGSDFRQQYTVTPVTLNPGLSTTVQVYISHGTAVEESSTGAIKVTDVGDESKFDTKSVGISMTRPKSCVPYSEEARGQSIYKCNAQGTQYDLVTTCLSGTVPALNAAGTNLECKDLQITIDTGNGSSFFADLWKLLTGDGTTSPLNTILTVVLVIIFGAIGLLMFYGILKAVILKKLT